MDESDRISEVIDLIEEDIIDIIATANEAGFSSMEVLQALEQVVKNARIALDEAPDPADDPEAQDDAVTSSRKLF